MSAAAADRHESTAGVPGDARGDPRLPPRQAVPQQQRGMADRRAQRVRVPRRRHRHPTHHRQAL